MQILLDDGAAGCVSAETRTVLTVVDGACAAVFVDPERVIFAQQHGAQRQLCRGHLRVCVVRRSGTGKRAAI
ncbi:hypothetical protein SDC9_129428 [bioreactor metagenome]|uniref:Uncharacterized protein n=1 Tax=bioreactor metagenome TaxID=1076179 RepID=A0A645CZL0_9ZZZZ